jgi:ParB family transcriptional regulator, chromosome partitioning protein
MKAADRLAQQLGANIDESMGAARQGASGGMFPSPVHGGPEKYQGSSRIKDALAIEIDRIVPDPDQPRKEFDPGDLEDLSASLKGRGQLQPIRVRWSATAERWVIVSGERRWRAARMAGLATLACIEAKGEMTPEEILEDQLVENCVRVDLKPIEQGRAYRRLMDLRGCSARQLAESLKISHQAVGRALSLLTLPEELQQQVETGLVPASAAAEIAKVEDDDTRREIAGKIMAGELTRDQTVEVVRQVAESKAASKPRAGGSKAKGRAASKGKVKLPTERTIKTPGGAKVTVAMRKGFDVRTWVEMLKEALEQATAKLEPAEQGGEQEAA